MTTRTTRTPAGTLPARRLRAAVESLETRRLLSAGNIYVGVSDQSNTYNILEYTQTGQLVGTPVFAPKSGGDVKDFIVEPSGDLQVYQGGFPNTANVVTVVPNGAVVGTHTTPGLNLIGRTFYGGIDANSRYVFVADMSTGGDNAPGQTGIVRFDKQNGYAVQRFSTDVDIQDVTIGQDGNVYGLVSPGGQPENGTVRVYNPNTLAEIREFTCPNVESAGVAADASGNVYIGSFDNGLYKVDSTGKTLLHITSINPTDLDLSTDNKLLAAGGGKVTVLDANLNTLSTFTTPTVLGTTFASWSTSQVPLGPDTVAPTAAA